MKITIDTTVKAPIDRVWSAWTTPADIVNWNFASDDWCCPEAQINQSIGGKFKYRMEAKDGSMGFDFEGEFTTIIPNQKIEYTLDDNRKVAVEFSELKSGVKIIETFDAEDQLSREQQKQGWQNILNNFKKHVESTK